ncbi:uncharacterized protein LOC110985929 [Acanthaster planci]|uniref:Uncharacterized protein LOC110985929 n=1 Tax=Acanthaster planci TaxID=133434 RepID=A0A8B7ZIJ5_ACAPL|nr:uncharacterized protein LOC110985929 [Acanthaster planci]
MAHTNASFNVADGEKGVKLTQDGPPPSYGGQAPNEAPPSYQSIMEKIKEAQANSETPAHFVGKSTNIVRQTACTSLCMGLSYLVPVSMVVMGSVFFDACPVEPMIPIYLIVFGAVYQAKLSIDLNVRGCRHRCQENGEEADDNKCVKFLNWLSRLFGIFLFGFFIAGNVWIFRNWTPSNDPSSASYCYGPLYYYAFWVTISSYIVVGLLMCCMCTCFICACCVCCKAAASSQSGTK